MERVFLTPEEAEAMLPEGDYVHTFRNTSGILVGADWERAEVIKALHERRPELSGSMASSMGHGMVFYDDAGAVFVATKKAAL